MPSSDDEEEEPIELEDIEQTKWAKLFRDERYSRATVRGHFVSTFYKYLLHVEGGCHSERQAMIHTRQVHMILETIDPKKNDLDCLVRHEGLEVWDKFAGPKLKNNELKGNTIKAYLRSLEFFLKFFQKGLFYDKSKLTESDKLVIINLLTRLPDYRSIVHRRTANQTTTRKVEEAFQKIQPVDIREFESSQLVKNAVHLLGEAISYRSLTKSEFTVVRDYLIITTMYENGARLGPLENALLSSCLHRVQQAMDHIGG